MLLSLIIWFPIGMALLLFALPIPSARLAKGFALFSAAAALVLSLCVFSGATSFGSNYAFEVRTAWVPDLGISYHLGVNRLNALLVLLTTLVGTAAIAISEVETSPRAFYALGLIMIGGMAGAFASLDLFFFYIFHEFALVPTFLLVGIWGGEKRRQAAMKIVIYLGLASLILLLGLLGVYLAGGGKTFDLADLKELGMLNRIPPQAQVFLFGLLFLGFGALVALVPFHTWAPMGYAEAPPLAAMLHAGVIKKFGLYGLFAVAIPLLPHGAQFWVPWMVGLGVANLLYAGYVAMQQKDLRYMLAYASVSHMGYAFLALAAWIHLSGKGAETVFLGFVLFLFAHGLTAALGFALAGHLRHRTGATQISELGGLAKTAPFLAGGFTMAALAGFGVPGFANFPAEIMIFLGSFHPFPWATVCAVWTTLISAIYFLRAVRGIFLGPLPEKWKDFPGPGMAFRAAVILLIFALLLGGFWPRGIVGDAAPRAPFPSMAAK